MLAVIDTNVWVSAFLTPAGTAAQVLDAFRKGRLTPVFSTEVLAEYRQVLSRPKFGISHAQVTEFLDRMQAEGRLAYPDTRIDIALPDPSDAPCIALARYVGCPAVTGNLRHFPPETGVEALTPAACLARLGGQP